MTKLIYSCLIITFSIFIITSCKNESVDTAKNDKETLIKELEAEGYSDATVDIASDIKQIKQWREYAKKAIEFRRKEDNNKAWQILDVDLWEYEFKFEKQKVSEPGALAGRWIDFDQNLTYTYGYFDKQEGSGQYHYNLDTQDLLLLDDDESIKPFEYKAKIVNTIMILQGNATYKDNSVQAKLKRVNKIPAK